jgi:hypothetical protein
VGCGQADVELWEKRLSLLSDTLDEWVQCQRSWMYLETIFSAEDIQRQLPAEAAKFHTVDKKVPCPEEGMDVSGGVVAP